MTTHKLKLEPTAAMVMEWALPLYKDPTILKYLGCLDLSSGRELLEKIEKVCQWGAPEGLRNRKNCIKQIILERLIDTNISHQLIVIAAGKTPLALEILLEQPEKIAGSYEIDLGGMEEKSKIYKQVAPQFTKKLHCLSADVTDSDLLHRLVQNGYQKTIPTFVVLEGISYYITKEELRQIVSFFTSPQKTNRIIVEYLVPFEDLTLERQAIARGIFGPIQEKCSLPTLSQYRKEDLAALFKKMGGELLSHYTLSDMEKLRTGKNQYFFQSQEGWIECVVGAF